MEILDDMNAWRIRTYRNRKFYRPRTRVVCSLMFLILVFNFFNGWLPVFMDDRVTVWGLITGGSLILILGFAHVFGPDCTIEFTNYLVPDDLLLYLAESKKLSPEAKKMIGEIISGDAGVTYQRLIELDRELERNADYNRLKSDEGYKKITGFYKGN